MAAVTGMSGHCFEGPLVYMVSSSVKLDEINCLVSLQVVTKWTAFSMPHLQMGHVVSKPGLYRSCQELSPYLPVRIFALLLASSACLRISFTGFPYSVDAENSVGIVNNNPSEGGTNSLILEILLQLVWPQVYARCVVMPFTLCFQTVPVLPIQA